MNLIGFAKAPLMCQVLVRNRVLHPGQAGKQFPCDYSLNPMKYKRIPKHKAGKTKKTSIS